MLHSRLARKAGRGHTGNHDSLSGLMICQCRRQMAPRPAIARKGRRPHHDGHSREHCRDHRQRAHSRAAVARHRGLSLHDRAAVRRSRALHPRAGGGHESRPPHPAGGTEESFRGQSPARRYLSRRHHRPGHAAAEAARRHREGAGGGRPAGAHQGLCAHR